MSYGPLVTCRGADGKTCKATCDSSRFGKIKASAAGWFFPKDDEATAYCPDHVPGWVASWRARRAAGK